jgi:hypothetical protein
MKPIPNEAIDAIPLTVNDSRESCRQAADSVLLVLFAMGLELETLAEWPPILSNGREVWPLPQPWTSDESRAAVLMLTLNGVPGDPGFLAAVKRNATEFNEALETNDIPLAQNIAGEGPTDSAQVWSDTNALACSGETADVYRPLELSQETKAAFALLSIKP